MKKESQNKTADLAKRIRAVKAGGKIGFSEYASLWLDIYKSPPKVRESTRSIIENTVRNHLVNYFGDTPMTDIAPMDIQLWLNTLSDICASHQRKCLLYLRNIFDTAVDNGLVNKSPVSNTIKITSTESKEREEPLTNDQARRLLHAVEGTRAYPFILIALSTGMRRGEILGLMWEDIDFGDGFITVTHQKAFENTKTDTEVTTVLKTDAAHRRIPMTAQLKEYLLEEYGKTKSPYVIHMRDGASLTRASFRSLWDIVESRQITEDRPMGTVIPGARVAGARACLEFKCHPHLLRHTFCTQCIEAGMEIKEVQYLMGHATPEITMGIYAHYRQKCRESDTADKMRNVISYLA